MSEESGEVAARQLPKYFFKSQPSVGRLVGNKSEVEEERLYSSDEGDDEEDIDVGSNDAGSDTEAAMDLTSEENLKQKRGVRSFGIDDILSHQVAGVARVRAGLNAAAPPGSSSPLDALFTMTSSFAALKQQSGDYIHFPSGQWWPVKISKLHSWQTTSSV